MRLVTWLVATSLVTFAGCARNGEQTGAPAAAAAADTVRGVVRNTGAEPATSIVLDAGAAGVVVVSGERAVLEQLAGMEVTVWGARLPPNRFEVARVAVRAVGGVAAIDGVLERDDDGYVLRTAGGARLAVPHLPPDLRSRVGARVWLAGPLDRAPDSYGVIR
jgi:hypothetical protein